MIFGQAWVFSVMARIVLLPKGVVFECDAGESIYDAAARQEIRFPVSCRNGVCEICKARLLIGELSVGASAPNLSANAGHQPEVMLCRAVPQSDCEIEIESVYARGELPLKSVVCQVESVSKLDNYIYKASLLLPAGGTPEFYAGQYLSLEIPGFEEASYFSIASAPGPRLLELHIQADPHLERACKIVEFLNGAVTVKLNLPHGKACLPTVPDQELILIAAGTGFAQMKSLIEFLLPNGFAHPLTLYWGVRKEQDMYMREQAEQWQREYKNFQFRPHIADIDTIDGVDHHNQLAEAVLGDEHDIANSLVFTSGSPRLVFSVLDSLEQAGLPEDQFFSDVLEYAERPR